MIIFLMKKKKNGRSNLNIAVLNKRTDKND